MKYIVTVRCADIKILSRLININYSDFKSFFFSLSETRISNSYRFFFCTSNFFFFINLQINMTDLWQLFFSGKKIHFFQAFLVGYKQLIVRNCKKKIKEKKLDRNQNKKYIWCNVFVSANHNKEVIVYTIK